MKYYLFFFGILQVFNCVFSQNPKLQLDYMILDRGEILQNEDGLFRFPFTNTGEDTLIIGMVKSSCGCLVPMFNRKPIPPGATDTIYGKYDTRRLGIINKSMTISSNDPTNYVQVVGIRGYVNETPAPVRFFSSDSLPKNYHRSFFTPLEGKELYIYRFDSIRRLDYTIGASDSIEIYLENRSTDPLMVNLENLKSLKIVKCLTKDPQVILLPNKNLKLQFVVVNRSHYDGDHQNESVTFLINDDIYKLRFSYPYK